VSNRGRSQILRGVAYDHDVAQVDGEAESVDLVVEEPLTIQLDWVVVATTMRTPGDDFKLAAGYCHTEGLLDGHPVTDVRYCSDEAPGANGFNLVNVETWGQAPTPTPRLSLTGSSCGICGDEAIEELTNRLSPLPSGAPTPVAVLAQLGQQVRAEQALFAQTGGSHAAAAFTPAGDLVAVAEDIGRHNAVDKVIGHLVLKDQIPAPSLGLFVSSRASFEIIQKAWAAGFGTVVAVSAPSALAVETAQAANITLAAFARNSRLTLFT